MTHESDIRRLQGLLKYQLDAAAMYGALTIEQLDDPSIHARSVVDNAGTAAHYAGMALAMQRAIKVLKDDLSAEQFIRSAIGENDPEAV